MNEGHNREGIRDMVEISELVEELWGLRMWLLRILWKSCGSNKLGLLVLRIVKSKGGNG